MILYYIKLNYIIYIYIFISENARDARPRRLQRESCPEKTRYFYKSVNMLQRLYNNDDSSSSSNNNNNNNNIIVTKLSSRL